MSRTVVVKGVSGLRQTATIGPHHFVADEAKDLGGNDEGPDPYEYLLAALGTCTNMTVRMYTSLLALASCTDCNFIGNHESNLR